MPKMIPQGESALPSPGDARREVLAERTDVLAEAAETRAGQLEVERASPHAFDVEPELAQHFNELDVSEQDPAYMYCWVQSSFYGQFVKRKLVEGWEVVQGDMPEAVELKGMGADSTRRLGDTILMRCRKDRYLVNLRREDEKRRRQQEGVTSVLEELGHKHRDRGVKIHTDLATLPASSRDRVTRRAAARQQATKTMDTWIRQGRVPGMPASRG